MKHCRKQENVPGTTRRWRRLTRVLFRRRCSNSKRDQGTTDPRAGRSKRRPTRLHTVTANPERNTTLIPSLADRLTPRLWAGRGRSANDATTKPSPHHGLCPPRCRATAGRTNRLYEYWISVFRGLQSKKTFRGQYIFSQQSCIGRFISFVACFSFSKDFPWGRVPICPLLR